MMFKTIEFRKEEGLSFGTEETTEEEEFKMSNNKLSATVLEKRDDISNFCKTISRKQILNKMDKFNNHFCCSLNHP